MIRRPSRSARGEPGAFDELRADCDRCAALCCVALALTASADFAIDKLPGTPCPNLERDFRCAIHSQLRTGGFRGCAAFDCFGAGQHVTKRTFAGRDWRRDPAIAGSMFAVFAVVLHLKELAFHLAQATALAADGTLGHEALTARAAVEALIDGQAAELERFDVLAFHEQVAALLARVSDAARQGQAAAGTDRRDADLSGAALGRADLRGANLRGAILVGADLSHADCFRTDLLGANLAGANLSGARLESSLFLTQGQLEAATGDAETTIPTPLGRPSHWVGGSG